MIKHTSRFLDGVALDWAVARAEKMQVFVDVNDESGKVVREMGVDGEPVFRPRQDWAFVGGIIVRERIVLIPSVRGWFATSHHVKKKYSQDTVEAMGDDPLTSVLRCLVRIKLGNVVEIPVELAGIENCFYQYCDFPRNDRTCAGQG